MSEKIDTSRGRNMKKGKKMYSIKFFTKTGS